MNTELGKRLCEAREKRGLSIEEAAHATRLRPSHVQALEDGNFSRFPNAAYAKGFLTMYARYLGVDVKDVTRAMETERPARVADYQYLSNRTTDDADRKREAGDARYDFVVPQKDRSWAPMFLVGALAVVGLGIFVMTTNMARIDEAPGPAEPPAAPPAEPPAAIVAEQPKPAPAPEIPRAKVVALPEGTVPAAIPVENVPLAEPEIPRAKAVSPVAALAADDAAALAELLASGTRSDATPAAVPEPEVAPEPEEEYNPLAADPNTIVLEPNRRAWVVIRNGPGGQPLYEDFLYPSAKPLRLPAGRYFIELREADSVEISRNGRRIAYSAPGVLVE